MRKLNTHFYDGQLQPRYQEIVNAITNPIPLETTYQEISVLIKTLPTSPKTKQRAHQIINILKTDSGKPANFDSRNQIHVDQLLPLVWTRVKEYDDSAKRIFIEQLAEIQGGLCPQGRTTRLIQMVELQPPPLKPTEPSSETPLEPNEPSSESPKVPLEPIEPSPESPKVPLKPIEPSSESQKPSFGPSSELHKMPLESTESS
jgi:hypothetical protein